MFVINKAKLEALYRSFNKLLDQSFDQSPYRETFDLIATETRDPNFELHSFISARLNAGMKEDTGEPEAGAIRVEEVVQRVKRWYDAFSMSVDDFNNDKLDLYRSQIEDMAESYMEHRTLLATAVLESGFSSNSYDGQPFFSTSHRLLGVPGQTQSNLVTGGFGETTLKKALELLGRMRNDNGRILGLRGTHLIVPPELEYDARKLVEATLIGGGDTNILAGRLTVVTNPFLTAADKVYVLDASRRMRKPVIFHLAKPPRLVPDDTKVVSREVIEWYFRGTYNAYLGIYQTIVAITP